MGDQGKLQTCVEAIENAIAEHTALSYGHAQGYALSTIIAALRIVTLNMETQYIEAIKARIQ